MTMSRFWVIGGEYRDCSFERLIEGTERLLGPFPTRGEAERRWREMSEQHRNKGLFRLTIAAEPGAMAGAAG